MNKKWLICLLLPALLCSGAYALRGSGYPAYDGASPAANSICGTIDGQSMTLQFDGNPEFSFVEGGFAQACFFAFDEKQDYYTDIYFLFPENVSAGMILTPQAPASEGLFLSLFEVGETTQEQYLTNLFQGELFPADSSFTIRIEEANSTEDSFHVSGTIDAVLSGVSGKEMTPTGKQITIENAKFDFSLPTGKLQIFTGTQPEATQEPAPLFTLPPHYAEV